MVGKQFFLSSSMNITSVSILILYKQFICKLFLSFPFFFFDWLAWDVSYVCLGSQVEYTMRDIYDLV